MTRTNIDIDDDLVHRAMRAFGLRTERETVQLALERLLEGGPMSPGEQLGMAHQRDHHTTHSRGGPMSLDEQLGMEGVGWDGDLDAMRADRFVGWNGSADS